MGTEALTDEQTKHWRLRRCALLDSLSDADIRQLGRMSDLRVLDRGVTLYDVGDPGTHLFIVESGVVKLSRVSADGREVNVGILGPVELFGEGVLVGDTQRADRAATIEDSVLCAIEAGAFEEFLLGHPHLAVRVTKLVGDRLRRVESRMHDILFHDVRTRLAHTVTRLAEKFGEDVPEGRRIGLRLTQTDLAQLIGSTRETTSTIFNEFRRQGLLDNDGHHVIVCDPDELAGY